MSRGARASWWLVIVLLSIAVWIGVAPDFAAAVGFLGSTAPENHGGVALAELVTGAAAITLSGALLLRSVRRRDWLRRPIAVRAALLAAGVACLMAGVVRHVDVASDDCCGGVSEAQRVLEAGP